MVIEKQRKTFLSYSRANKDFAVKLAKELKSEGFDIWLDQLDIPLGARWDREVEKALRASDIFMIILTTASVDSENVLDEIGYAIDTSKRILPILLENCEVPLRLRRLQYVDFTNKSFDEGVKAAKELLRGLIAQPTIPRGTAVSDDAQVNMGDRTEEQADRLVDQIAESDSKAKEEADRKVNEEADYLATQKADADRKAKQDADRKAKEEADRLAAQKADEDRRAREKAQLVETKDVPISSAPTQKKPMPKGLMIGFAVVVSLVIAVVGINAWLNGGNGGGDNSPNITAHDLLGTIRQRGYIVVSTDASYEPQSFLDTSGSRMSDTQCPSNALTTSQLQGFDVDVAIEIGNQLGVETCFVTPSWDDVTAGSWGDQWDINVGSMTITTNRQQLLDFRNPYYYYPSVVVVGPGVGIGSIVDLEGATLCVGASTSQETWLNGGDLGLPASSVYTQPPTGIEIVSLDTTKDCAQYLADGRVDGIVAYEAALSDLSTVVTLKVVGKVFSEDLAVVVDKSSSLSTESLLAEVNKTITQMKNNGRLSQLSLKWFGEDLTN